MDKRLLALYKNVSRADNHAWELLQVRDVREISSEVAVAIEAYLAASDDLLATLTSLID